jgi:hypothetical protein
MAGLEIRPVRTRRELKRFVKVPFALHRDHPQWVPPLISERMRFLDRRRNPYFEHAEAEYFLAERDGEPVGRITAQVDSRWDSYQGGSDAMFGFYESVDDEEVARALLDAAAGWARGKGRARLLGPMDFTTNDEIGLLIEGFDRRPLILEPWHPPYYRRQLEALGMSKAMDLLMWELQFGRLKEGDRFDPAIHAAAERALEDEDIVLRSMRKSDMANEIRRFTEVYNDAWGDNWGFVPVSDAEAGFQARNLKQVIDEQWAFIAEKDGEPIGAGLTLPDINQVLARMGGRLLPFGWLRFLLGRRRIDQCRVFALGVKRDYHHTGVGAGLYLKNLAAGGSPTTPIDGGEMGWVLETNEPMNRALEGMGGSVVKRYRVYQRGL